MDSAASQLVLAQHPTFFVRAVVALLVAAIVAAVGMFAFATPGVRAGSDAEGLKAVIIVGPASSSTSEYLREGEQIARQAERQGMDVRRIFTPNATWKRVKQNIQGANLVVYLGHGNGWPSGLGPYRPESKNGFGLNPCDGDCGTSAPTEYYGEAFIRDDIELAPHAVVFLNRLCYAAGNGESGMAPVFNKGLATERASNFASGFIDAGAGVVFALGWEQKVNLPEMLATSNKTMDQIFMMKGSDYRDAYDGFIGWDDYYRESTRDSGARVHQDPHPRHGHLRAITGNLELTADEWRGDGPPPDETAPVLKVRGAGTTDDPSSAGAGKTVTFSPDADGEADRMIIRHSLSEPAFVELAVWNEAEERVRSVTDFDSMGSGTTTWDGRDDSGNAVPDGRYRVGLTPRDRADNVGDTVTLRAKVLTTLRRLTATERAIHVSDGDTLADDVVFRSLLRQDATVTWLIRRGKRVVQKYYAAEPLTAGRISWRWDGTDRRGAYVPDGTYDVTITATTDLGTMRHKARVVVGNWRISVDDRTPRRRQEVKVSARSLEPLRGKVKLEITQPGVGTRIVSMKLTKKHRATATFRIAKGADRGKIRLRVIARDIKGQRETGDYTIRLR